MKVSRAQAAENHNRIIEIAARLFSERGLDGVGVADLMKEAGLTHGGFYGHFKSKDDLVVQACLHAMEHSAARWRARTENSPKSPLKIYFDDYLSPAHRDSPGGGCVFTTLAIDAARGRHPGLRGALSDGLRRLAERLTGLLPGGGKAARRQRALAQIALSVGAVILARATDEADLSDEILAAARTAIEEA